MAQVNPVRTWLHRVGRISNTGAAWASAPWRPASTWHDPSLTMWQSRITQARAAAAPPGAAHRSPNHRQREDGRRNHLQTIGAAMRLITCWVWPVSLSPICRGV